MANLKARCIPMTSRSTAKLLRSSLITLSVSVAPLAAAQVSPTAPAGSASNSGATAPTPAPATASAASATTPVVTTDPATNLPPANTSATATPPPQPVTPQPGTTQPGTPAATAAATSSAPATTPAAPPPALVPKTEEPKTEWLRDGFYFRMLSGTGYMSLRGDGPTGTASVAGVGSNSLIIIGGSIARRWVFAGSLLANQVSGKFKGGPYQDAALTYKSETLDLNKNATVGLVGIGALVDWFPLESAGLHVGLGAGLGMISVINELDKTSQFGTTGLGTLIVGYDWSISRAWALGLALVGTGSSKATLKHAKTSNESGYSMTPFSLGVSGSLLFF